MTSESAYATSNHAEPAKTSDEIRVQVLAYYTAAAMDYRAWSRGFNMHFGFWRMGLNPFRREAMLEELNAQVLKRLGFLEGIPAKLVDLNQSAVRGGEISMHCADFTSTGLPSGCADAVCMIESACHAAGPTKESVLSEAFRLLRPGGRLVMVDAMLLREVPQAGLLSRLMNHVYRQWCRAWAVPELCRADLVHDQLKAIGFESSEFANWSWNVAPSVAHVPLFASVFAIVEVIKAKGALPLWRWRHIVASLLTPLLGLRRCTFVYGVISARKAGLPK